MRTFLYLVMIVVALSGPYRYLTAGKAARDARFARLEQVQEDAVGVQELLGDAPPPARHQLATRQAALDRLDAQVAAVGRSLEAEAAPGVETLRAAGERAGVSPTILAPLLATIDRGVHAPMRRRALLAVLDAVEAAGASTLEALDVAAAPSTRTGAPPLTLLQVGLTAVGSPTALVTLAEALAAGKGGNPPGDLVEARLEKIPPDAWDRVAAGADAPPTRLVLRIEFLLGGA